MCAWGSSWCHLAQKRDLRPGWDCESGMSQPGWVLAWRAEYAAPESAPATPDPTKVGGKHPKERCCWHFLGTWRQLFGAEAGEQGKEPKSVKAPRCCSL